MTEEWRDIDGYEWLYKVSNTGKIKSIDRILYIGKTHGHTFKRATEKDVLRLIDN